MDYTEYDFQRPQSALHLKGRPESAKQKQQISQAYGGSKKLPQVRPHSAVVVKNSMKNTSSDHRFKKQTDDDIIEEEQDSEFLNYEKQGIDINALFLHPPSSMPENKKLPKNIKKEKEKLYEEQIELKQQMNKLKDENTRVKTKNLQLQKENAKLEKLLENLDTYIQTGQGHQPFSDHLLMNNLKKTLKELKSQLNERDGELITLKKQGRVTKVQELEAELKNYIEESIRLRSLLDQALRNQAAQKMAIQMDSFEEKFYVQMKVINSLQQEIDQFQGQMKMKDDELFNAQVRCEQFDTLQHRAEDELESLKSSLNEQNEKMELFQQEIQNLKTINNNLIIKATKSHNDDVRIQELEQQTAELSMDLQQSQNEISALEKQIQSMKHQEQETFKTFERERKQLENDMEYYKNQFEMFEEKYKNLLLVNAQGDEQVHSGRKSSRSTQRMGTMQILPSFQQAIIEEQPKRNEQSYVQEKPIRPQSGIRRKRAVKMDDVKDLGLELNMRFRLRKLKLEQIIENELLDPVIRDKGIVSIKDIALKLSDEPFELKDVEKMYLLARYLVEDNSQGQDWIDFDEEATASLQIVRSIFKQLIGKCRIFSEEEEKQYKDEIQNQIVKYKKSILSYLPTFNSNILSRDQITKAFNYMGIQLSGDAYDYFFLRLFELQGELDVKNFEFKLILDEWGKDDNYVNVKKRMDRRDTKKDIMSQQFVYGSKFTFEK